MTIFLLIVALLAFLAWIVGSIWFTVNAFRTHILWGVLCLLFTPACILFCFKHWEMARRPTNVSFIAIVVLFTSVHFMPNTGSGWGSRFAHITGAADEHAQPDQQAQPEKRALPPMFEAQKQMELQIRLVALQKRENDLLERKSGLDPKDRAGAIALTAEINKYNDDLKPVLQEMRDRGMVAAQ